MLRLSDGITLFATSISRAEGCLTEKVSVLDPDVNVTVPALTLKPLFISAEIVIVAVDEPLLEDNEIHEAFAVAVQELVLVTVTEVESPAASNSALSLLNEN